MNINEFDYDLPKELIAQKPIKNREESRLLMMDKKTGELKDEIFKNIINYLNKGDVLVINNTKVIPARIKGIKEETGAFIEVLLLRNIKDDVWECLIKPFKRVKVGTIIIFNDDLKGEIIEKLDEGIVRLNFSYEGILMEILDKIGTMPLPPYIHESLKDQSRYQTVYAEELGSAAAPTAGLHFTKELLSQIKAKGVIVLEITLHVGLGTFRPVVEENILDHQMHSEFFHMDEDVALKLNQAKKEKRKIYAVGTTSCRTLEAIMTKYHQFVPCSEETNIFIYPGYEFKAIDGLITNFHLPKSTLIMLVSSLSTKENILNAYQYAIKHKYHFFSFGDAMFIK